MAEGTHPIGGTVTTIKGRHRVPLTACVPESPTEGIVVIQDAMGVTDALVAALQRLAADGYLAVAPHLYHRVAKKPAREFAEAEPLMRTLNGPDLAHDIADAVDYLDAAGIPAASRGIVGFCMGGTVSLWQAAEGDFGAAVTFYGGGVSKKRWKGVPPGLESAPAISCPWLGLYGDKDRSIRVEEVEELREITDALPVHTSILRYANAGHAFALDPEAKNFVPDAAADSWAHALNWFDAHLR